MKRLLKLSLILLILLCTRVSSAGYFMPAYWMYSHSEPIFMKDITNNILSNVNHDSMEFVFSQGVSEVENGIPWYSFHWEWVYKRPLMMGSYCGVTYRRIPVESLFGEQGGYIVVKGDIYEGDRYDWSPWKKVSKVYWELNDPISQNVTEYSKGIAVLTGSNTWVLRENLYFLNNYFCDGTQKNWEGSILHLVEYEPNGNEISYWLMQGKGIIRLRISTNGYIWLEVGAY